MIDDGTREPVNDFDVSQREEALRRSGKKYRDELNKNGQKSRGKGQRVRDVTFFVGEDLTLKGRRFKVSHIIGESAVVLEPIGDMVLREGIGRRNQANVVGRRNLRCS